MRFPLRMRTRVLNVFLRGRVGSESGRLRGQSQNKAERLARNNGENPKRAPLLSSLSFPLRVLYESFASESYTALLAHNTLTRTHTRSRKGSAIHSNVFACILHFVDVSQLALASRVGQFEELKPVPLEFEKTSRMGVRELIKSFYEIML